jgi:hypothetical protein
MGVKTRPSPLRQGFVGQWGGRATSSALVIWRRKRRLLLCEVGGVFATKHEPECGGGTREVAPGRIQDTAGGLLDWIPVGRGALGFAPFDLT